MAGKPQGQSPFLARVRPFLWGAAAVAAIGYAGLAILGAPRHAPAAGGQGAGAAIALDALRGLGRGVEDVELRSAAGATRWGDLHGAPRAVFFGFTHCPDICPSTAADLARAIEALGPAGDGLKVHFVTVDPQRDDPATLARYFSGFEGRIEGFSGDPAAIERLAQAFKVYYRAVPTTGDDYTVDHTTLTYLLNGKGEVIDILPYQTPPERAAEQLKRLIAAG